MGMIDQPHAWYKRVGIIRVTTEAIKSIRRLGIDLKPVRFPLFKVPTNLTVSPMTPVHERRFDQIKQKEAEE